MAANCRDTVERTTVDGAAVQLAKAVCRLRAASALRAVSKPEEAVSSADIAVSLISAVTDKSSQEIESAEQMARTYQELTHSFWALGNLAKVIAQLEEAVELLQPIARSNPQNDEIADLLAELLAMQASAYRQTDRNDLAARALEIRVELARTRREL